MLQTLSKNALLKYLPKNGVAQHAGTHLNIALPLHQRPNKVRVDFQDPSIFHSNDPLVQQYYTSLRRRFHELKFSPNPSLREYYANVLRQRVIQRVNNNTKKILNLCNGVEVNTRVRRDLRFRSTFIQTFILSYFKFTIPRTWGKLEHDEPIQVRPELISKEEFMLQGKHPNVHCLKATNKDPASRLAIFVEGTFADGAPFAGWIRSNGENQVYKMNTLVDLLEGGTMLQSSDLPRRWISLKYQNKQGKIQKKLFYT
jgi:hypothetical protein